MHHSHMLDDVARNKSTDKKMEPDYQGANRVLKEPQEPAQSNLNARIDSKGISLYI